MFAVFLMEEMNPFYENISSFPTLFFTVALLVTLFFWLIAILGLVDIDVLDVDGVDGSDGMGPEGDNGALAGLMLRFGLTGVPVTIIISFISLIGWIISYYASHYFVMTLPDSFLRYLSGAPVFLGALYASTMLTAQIIKPLRTLFRKTEQDTTKRVLGQTAIVRTSRVDEKFGEASLEDGGAGLILKVRAAPGKVFTKGDRVVLLEYNQEQNTYRVIPEHEFSGM